MQRLRDLLRSLEGQPAPPTRPTSLYEAGNVGSSPGKRPVRREAPPDAWFESGSEPTAEERTTRRERPVTGRRRTVAETPQATTLAAQQIQATLQNPASLRSAILLREVLDPPVSRRPRKR